MALTFFWRCEGTTLDGTDDFSAGDTTATANGTVSIDAAAARVGTNGILIGAGNSHYRFDTASIATRLAGSLGFSFRVTTAPSSNAMLMTLRGTNANDYYAVYITNGFAGGTGQLRVEARSTDTGGALVSAVTSDFNGSVDTWYSLVIRWDDAANILRVEGYNDDGSLRGTPAEHTAGFVAPLDLTLSTGVRMGEATGVSMVGHMDNVFIADAYAEPIEDNFHITSYTGYAGAGGTVNTATLTDLVIVADDASNFLTRGVVASDELTIADAAVMFFRLQRLLESAITVTEGPTVLSTVHNVDAIDTVTIADELLRFARYHRLLSDDIVITDDAIASVIGYLIYFSVLTSEVAVTDESIAYRLFNRMLDDGLLTTDQALAALSYTRDMLDGLDVYDEAFTSLQRFILLTDTISVDDSFSSLVVTPTTDSPIIRIGADQPRIELGGYAA